MAYPLLLHIRMFKSKLTTIGLTGSALAALCCFTPLLPAVLTAVGLTSLLDILYNDTILLPVLAGFLGLTGLGLVRQRKR